MYVYLASSCIAAKSKEFASLNNGTLKSCSEKPRSSHFEKGEARHMHARWGIGAFILLIMHFQNESKDA